MANYSISVDVLQHVYRTAEVREVGHESIYVDTPHPATNQTIGGWEWDRSTWPADVQFDALEHVPALYDANTSGLDISYWQGGIGDGDDLLLLSLEEEVYSGVDIWTPKIFHGYFYPGYEEWYLYSDDYQTEYFTASGLAAGRQYVDLDHIPKGGIPLQVRRYLNNSLTGQYTIDLDLKKAIEFEASGMNNLFMVDTDQIPPRVWLDDDYSEEVGQAQSPVSGVVPVGDLVSMERLGLSTGEPFQEFFSDYSPIDRSQPVELWSQIGGTDMIQWEVIHPTEDFTASGYQVKVDYDTGSFRFGLTVPGGGRSLVLRYTKGMLLMYEPQWGRDYILAPTADVNPIAAATYRGFVQAGTIPSEPASITLEAELPGTPNPSYLINLGNNSGRIIATVRDPSGNPLEGQEVFFEVQDPQIGYFGGTSRSISAVTNAEGQAKVFYNSPRTIQDVGQATTEVSHVGSDTVMYVDNVTDPGTLTDLFFYKVHEYDEVLGIENTDITGYYTDFFTEEEIAGDTATADWEGTHRAIHSMLTPVFYTSEELTVGKKTILLTSDRSTVIDPHTGDVRTSSPYPLGPLQPDVIDDVGTETAPRLKLTFQNIALPLIGVNDTKAYFIVGASRTGLKASTTSRRTRKTIYSNEIGILVQIPETLNGTYQADELGDAPSGLMTAVTDVRLLSDAQILTTSGLDTFYEDYLDERDWTGPASGYETYPDWFRRTRRGDSVGLAQTSFSMETILLDPALDTVAGEIPLGFRLKSSGIRLASVLDQVTYIDPNDHLPSGYFPV